MTSEAAIPRRNAEPALAAATRQSPAASEQSARELLRRQRAVAAPHLRIANVLSLASGLAVIAQAWLVAGMLDAVAFRAAPALDIARPLLALLAVVAVRAVLVAAAERAAQRAGNVVKRRLRAELVAHIAGLGPIGLGGEPTGRLVAALTDSLNAIAPYYGRYLPATFLAAVLPVVIVLLTLPLDWVSAVVMLVTAPLIPLFMVLIGDGAERLNRRQWARLARMSGHFLDAVQGLATLKLFNAATREAARVARVAEAYRRDTMAVLRLAFLSSLVLEFFATVSIAMIAVLVGFRLLWGEMSFFRGFLVLLLAPELYLPLRALGAAYHARMEALAAAERVSGVLDRPRLQREMHGARTIDAAWTDAGRGIAIAFEDVRVVHEGGRVALDGLSCSIAAGERVALVGASGAGKSTLLALLLGFVVPTSGRVLVNGVPLAVCDLDSWRRLVAYLPQRPHMFEATMAQNIAMSLDPPLELALAGDEADTMARVRTAARRAGADGFIVALPQGYATPMGEHGVGLSGGEAQRVALARAFYRDTPLVLVDEAAAHLDHDSAAAVSRALAELAGGRTMIEVAHRLDAARAADRILVLDAGRVIEEGRHDDLVASGGRYAALWSSARPSAEVVSMDRTGGT